MAYKNKERMRNWRYKHVYGISLDEYVELANTQNNLCAICNKDNKGWYLAVDHCHETDRIRGLLCNTCNRALGLFNESPALLEKAAGYLRSVTH